MRLLVGKSVCEGSEAPRGGGRTGGSGLLGPGPAVSPSPVQRDTVDDPVL